MPLADEWVRQYPQLFDADDLRQTIKQPAGHFCEWFVAIYLYHRHGALSLIEKYAYANHLRKVQMLEKLLSRPRSLGRLPNVRSLRVARG